MVEEEMVLVLYTLILTWMADFSHTVIIVIHFKWTGNFFTDSFGTIAYVQLDTSTYCR